MKVLRMTAIAFTGYVVLCLFLVGAIAYFQPEDEGTTVLHTFDSVGREHTTVVRVHKDEDGQIWLWSANWFRGWYKRALTNPQVELVEDDMVVRLCASAVVDPSTIENVVSLRRSGVGQIEWWVVRAFHLFAPDKALRLDYPTDTSEGCA